MGIQDRKQREFERRENDILTAALALFDGNNWDQVTVAEIARRAEIGKGTVYKHFSTKEEIYAKLALNFASGLLAQLTTVDTDKPPREALRLLLETCLHYHFEHPEYARVAQYCGRQDFRQRLEPTLRNAFDELDRTFFELGREHLTQGIADGVFEDKPLSHHQVGLTATFQGAVALAWDLGCGRPLLDLDIATFAVAVTDFMLAGLSPTIRNHPSPASTEPGDH